MYLIRFEVFCWAVLWKLYVAILFFVGPVFFGVCGVSFNVSNRNVFSIFHRGSQDETMMRSVTV